MNDKTRRFPPTKYKATKQEFQWMIDQGIYWPFNSSRSSPLHNIKKANGTIRLCGDYHRLNAHTMPDRYSVPNTADFNVRLQGKHIFSAAQTFQRFTDSLFGDPPFIIAYLDDLLITSKDDSEQEQHLRILSKTLSKHGVNLNPAKCDLGQTERLTKLQGNITRHVTNQSRTAHTRRW